MSRVVHYEVPADDPQRLVDFFEKAFGWQIEKWDGPMDYWLIMSGREEAEGEPGIDGGILRRADGNPMVVNTIDVTDLDAALAKVTEHGGEIVAPKMAVPTVGWMAYFKDTEGNVHGAMQAVPSAA